MEEKYESILSFYYTDSRNRRQRYGKFTSHMDLYQLLLIASATYQERNYELKFDQEKKQISVCCYPKFEEKWESEIEDVEPLKGAKVLKIYQEKEATPLWEREYKKNPGVFRMDKLYHSAMLTSVINSQCCLQNRGTFLYFRIYGTCRSEEFIHSIAFAAVTLANTYFTSGPCEARRILYMINNDYDALQDVFKESKNMIDILSRRSNMMYWNCDCKNTDLINDVNRFKIELKDMEEAGDCGDIVDFVFGVEERKADAKIFYCFIQHIIELAELLDLGDTRIKWKDCLNEERRTEAKKYFRIKKLKDMLTRLKKMMGECPKVLDLQCWQHEYKLAVVRLLESIG